MKGTFHFVLILSMFASLYAQNLSQSEAISAEFKRGDGKNYPATPWNKFIGSSDIEISGSYTNHSSMNNFICDAMLEMTNSDFSFINYGDISENLFPGEITELDLVALCPQRRTLVIFFIDGAFLKQLIEDRICGDRSRLAIGGGKVEYDPGRPYKSRLTFFKVGDHPVYPKKEYRVVTTDYLADGNAGFQILTIADTSKIERTQIFLRDAVKEYILRHSPLSGFNVAADNRCRIK